MKIKEAVKLGLETYVPDKPCARGHSLRKVKGRFCIDCKKITDGRYKNDPEQKARAAAWQKEYRREKGDEYRTYIREYMQEYRKTDKHTEWRKKHYDEVVGPKSKAETIKRNAND